MIGVNVLYGQLSDKNNPASSNYTDSDLFFFPGHFVSDGKGGTVYENNTVNMSQKTPYIELRLGVHNIFKLLHIEYIRRMTYRDTPNVNKDGIRFNFRMQF
jgi:hypothetical protein